MVIRFKSNIEEDLKLCFAMDFINKHISSDEGIILMVLSKDAYIRFSSFDVGIDLSNIDDVFIDKQVKLINTGVKLVLPLGFEAHVRPRSSLPLKFGLTVANSPGTIDASYRGDIGIELLVLDPTKYNTLISKHTRLAQLVISTAIYPVNYEYYETYNFVIVRSQELYDNILTYFPSDREDRGFGHTGST